MDSYQQTDTIGGVISIQKQNNKQCLLLYIHCGSTQLSKDFISKIGRQELLEERKIFFE